MREDFDILYKKQFYTPDMFESKVLTLKLPFVLITFGVLVFGFTCVGVAGHMPMYTTGSLHTLEVMSTDSQQECCAAGLSKFSGSWKSFLSVVPRELRDRLLRLLLGFAAVVVISRVRFQYEFKDTLILAHIRARDNLELAFSNHLKLAFSRGILNPKIY